MHQLLLESRYALEGMSRKVRAAWLGDLLFMLSCRRIIMLNELDRELGRFHVPVQPPKAGELFQDSRTEAGPQVCVELCEEEEADLVRELENLNNEPGLHGHTRNAIAALLRETRENLKDIGFLRENHPALQR